MQSWQCEGKTKMTYAIHLLSDARGIYLPRDAAETLDWTQFPAVRAEDLETLRLGPDAEFYWDAWEDVLDRAETKDGDVLHQDGDLWLIRRDAAVQDLNAYFADVLEYETRHGDAGDAYSHLVEDVDLQDVQRQLEDESMIKAEDGTGDSLGYKWVKKLDLDLRGLDVADVARLALDVFQMVPGSIWGPHEDGLVIGAFPVQEIETEIPSEFEYIVLDYIGDNATDAYITGTGRAYIATDAVWYAVASVKDLQDAINAEVLEGKSV
jgi:hypothetical protein